MIVRREALSRRRAELLTRSAALRERVRQRSEVLVVPLALADHAIDAASWLRGHPQLPLTLIGVWVVFRPRRAWRLAWRAWGLWRGTRRVLRAWGRLRLFMR